MDPALDEVKEAYARGDLVLFVGAGISAAAGLPTWPRLVKELTERAKARGAGAAVLDEIKALTEQKKLIDALTALKDTLGPNELYAAVERLCDDSVIDEPPEVAKAIAALKGLRAVLTTNIDHLLERAFAGAWPALPRATPDIARRRRFILKMHGTLMDRSTWVFTREEYDRAMHVDEALKAAFGAFFNACTLLFVGYGLDDDDFNAVLARVRAFSGNQAPRHFALVDAQTVTPYRRSTLERSGVRLIPYENPDGRHGMVPRILRMIAGAKDPPSPPPPPPPPLPPPPSKPQPKALLQQAEIHKIHSAALNLKLARSRDVLLGHLDAGITASLPIEGNPASQLLSDLNALNEMTDKIADGSFPLAVWLANALQLTRSLPASAVFTEALAALAGK